MTSPRRRAVARSVVGCLVALLLAGCGDFPPWSAPEPTDRVAVRTGPGGVLEAVLVPCGPARVARMELVTRLPPERLDAAPRAWRIDFVPPVELRDPVPIGSVPPGAVESVGWAGLDAVDPARGLLLVVVLDDTTTWSVDLRAIDGPLGDRVRFRDSTLSAPEFAQESRCP